MSRLTGIFNERFNLAPVEVLGGPNDELTSADF
jgi:hypothetical protein